MSAEDKSLQYGRDDIEWPAKIPGAFTEASLARHLAEVLAGRDPGPARLAGGADAETGTEPTQLSREDAQRLAATPAAIVKAMETRQP